MKYLKIPLWVKVIKFLYIQTKINNSFGWQSFQVLEQLMDIYIKSETSSFIGIDKTPEKNSQV